MSVSIRLAMLPRVTTDVRPTDRLVASDRGSDPCSDPSAGSAVVVVTNEESMLSSEMDDERLASAVGNPRVLSFFCAFSGVAIVVVGGMLLSPAKEFGSAEIRRFTKIYSPGGSAAQRYAYGYK